MEEMKKEQARKAISWLREHRLEWKGKSAEDSIREDRDSR